jgi:hypothetical protein
MGMALGVPQQVTFSRDGQSEWKGGCLRQRTGANPSRVSGTVKSIHREIGDYVPAGSVICSIESNDYITLQEEYNAVSNSYRMAKANTSG